VQFRFDDDRMVYADAAKGYRIGGVNVFPAAPCEAGLAALGLSADKARTFASDSVWSYEAGTKTRWLDRRLTVNATGFMIDWKGLQQTLGLGSCGFQATINIGAARSKGGELEVAWRPTKAVSLALGAGYTDAYVTDNGGLAGQTAAVGSRVQNVPKWTVNSALDLDGSIRALPGFIHVDYGYVADSYNARNAPRIRPSYSLVNLRSGVRFNSLELGLFVKNLTNKAADLGDVPPMVIQLPGRPRILTNTPRTIGAYVRFNVK
jgi:outer membrane receptor protein involved in Fe transport